jgi:hypothetical protein
MSLSASIDFTETEIWAELSVMQTNKVIQYYNIKLHENFALNPIFYNLQELITE